MFFVLFTFCYAIDVCYENQHSDQCYNEEKYYLNSASKLCCTHSYHSCCCRLLTCHLRNCK